MGEIIFLGIILSIVFYEMTDISPGGIIVPGIMVMYIHQIDRMIYTVVISIITCFVVQLFSKKFIVYGKRKFALMIITSLFINLILGFFVKVFTINMLNITVVGYTISGLIAFEMSKQGTIKTVSALTIVVGLLQLMLIIFSALGIII